MLYRIPVLVLLLLSACSNGPSEHPDVVAFLESYYTALSDRDWPRFEAHFLPEGRLVTVWTPPDSTQETIMNVTAAEFVAAADGGPGSRSIFEEKMVAWDVDARGSLATAWVNYEARFGDPGDIMEWQGTDAFSLLQTAEGWKIVSLTYAVNAE